jgi:recombination protein RecR
VPPLLRLCGSGALPHLRRSGPSDRPDLCGGRPRRSHGLERVGFFRAPTTSWAACISPLDNIGPDDLQVAGLLARLQPEAVREVILALNPSLEGEATTVFLSKLLQAQGVQVTRIAYGLPMGGDLKYADQQTIREALRHRVAATGA